MYDEFGYTPLVFRNTELIYQDRLADIVSDEGFKVILAEGTEKILDWRSPLYAYTTYNRKLLMLLKYYTLSDDIAFRFSDRSWPGFPLTADKFADWIGNLGLVEKGTRNLFVNLFMDYETFGEHQWKETGIFDFMRHLPEKIFSKGNIAFAWPSDALDIVNYQPESISFPYPVSWADTERDLSAWLDNDLQYNAIETLYDLLREIKQKGRHDLLDCARKLSTSDHFYYMCTKYFQDGDVHKYFSPYQSPEHAYMFYMNALADLSEQLG
jgi:alpha-amylase